MFKVLSQIILHSELMRYYWNCWGAIFDSHRKVGMIKITVPFHSEQTHMPNKKGWKNIKDAQTTKVNI